MRFKELLLATEKLFRTHGISHAKQEVIRIASWVTTLDPATILLKPEISLTVEQQASFEQLVARRLKGEPLSRLFQERGFWKDTFRLCGATLDPRPDSETLIEAVLDLKIQPEKILELGVGSGCLLLSLLGEYPQAWGIGVDLSLQALDTTYHNARELGLSHRCSLINGSWTAGLKGPFDLIISNPPYIPTAEIAKLERAVRMYDPLLALDGGADGLEAYKKIAAGISSFLTHGGYILLEIGKNQEKAVKDIFLAQNVHFVSEMQDLAGITRVLVFQNSRVVRRPL